MSNSRPRRRADLLSVELGDETLLHTVDGKTIHILNASALTIWKLCDGEHCIADIERAMRTSFSMPEMQADLADDVQRTLDIFAEKGLLATD